MSPDALAQAVRRLVVRYLEQERPTRKTAVVTSTSPLQVMFPGDTVSTTVATKAKSYTPVLNETVVLERVGPDRHGSTWVVVYAIEQL